MDLNKKLLVYQKKLLDTGRRNRLINYRFSLSSTVELLNDDFKFISEKVLEGSSFKFANLFEKVNEFKQDETGFVDACGKKILKKDVYEFFEIREIKNRFSPLKTVNYLFSNTITSTLKKTLRNLKNKANTFYEENGINVLYLAMGFISFTDIDGFQNKAPLCLIPISLEAKTIASDYILKAIDDNFLYNETLTYKLKLENKLDFPTPLENESIMDYLDNIKVFAIKNNMQVTDDISIGLFYFSKIKMYQDITDNIQIYLKNPILNTLVGNPMLVENDYIDTKEDLEVLNADDSQMKAIKQAKALNSFVLQGPPGCGKSQTITNIIGELIALNKSVLFVCEKKAALDVVYKNLCKRNLGQYCLALHDPKVNKKDIIDNIYVNLENIQNNRQTLSKKALDVYDTYHALEQKLDDYVKTITKDEYENLSVIDIIDIYYKNISANDIDIECENIYKILKSEKEIDSFILKFQKLGSSKEQNPYYGFKLLELDLLEKEEMVQVFTNLSKTIENLLRNQTFAQLNYFSIESLDDFYKTLPLYEFILNTPYPISFDYYHYNDLIEAKELAAKVKTKWLQYNEMENIILAKYDDDIYDLPIKEMLKEARNHTSIFRGFSKKYRDIKKILEANLKTYGKLKYKNILDDLNLLKQAIELKKNILLDDTLLRVKYNEIYFGGKTDFNKLESCLEHLIKYQELSLQIKEFAIDDIKLLQDISKRNLQGFNAEYSLILPYKEMLQESTIKYRKYFDIYDTPLDTLLINLKEQIAVSYVVYDYIEYNKAFKELALIDSNLPISLETYGKNAVLKFASKKVLNILNKKYGLNDEYLDYMKQYGECLRQMYDFSPIKIGELVSDSWPQLDSLQGSNKEVMVLRSEANKKRKLKALKDTFKEMPNLLKDLKPCFMMSPLSVATFIDPNVFHFDVVIFDEASQLTSENAIGSIARANSVIVCGDQEQLPPTSFFTQEMTDEDDTEYDVYESILDECKTVLPTIMLKWHYRSKNESLIEYSNQEIYHDLLTFKEPYVNKENQGVQYFYVENGYFEKGKNRINRAEAEKVCELIIKHMKEEPLKSLGVVTFNTTQQAYIESKLLKLRYENKEIDELFKENTNEPFFIKNLETVQGDERDKIIISIGYAKDDSGKLSMNFGPLNQTGGYKRLNVAITRAKESVFLVGSILPMDFDLSKTDARGVKMLKGYIEFAMSDKTKYRENNTVKSNIVSDIVGRIEKLGYKCDTKVGNSQVKIDIAVVDSNNIDYKLAIIIDSESYIANKASKDRNYLYAQVLKNRGWLVYHLFSYRYLENPNKVMEEINNLLSNGEEVIADINFESQEYQELKEITSIKAVDLFDVYPNVTGLVKEINKDNLLTINKTFKLIERISPIFTEDLYRHLLPFYGKTKLTDNAKELIEKDIEILISERKIIKSSKYILLKGQIFDVKFRRHDDLNEETRDVDHIYIDEIADAIIKIVKEINEIDKISLFAIISELLGYSKTTQKSIEIYERALVNCDHKLIVIGNKINFKE